MSLFLWTIVALLVGLIAVLQFIGVRALESWGVSPSRAVVGLRLFNLLVVVMLIAFVFWEWMRR